MSVPTSNFLARNDGKCDRCREDSQRHQRLTRWAVFLPAGWRWGCKVWLSMGKWSLLRMISWFLPVNLLALLMLLVCQSVQYRLSSNTVMAKGCGSPGESPRGPPSRRGLPGPAQISPSAKALGVQHAERSIGMESRGSAPHPG